MGVEACCEHLGGHARNKDKHSHSECLVDYVRVMTPEGDNKACNEAAYFKARDSDIFLYRDKNGDWVIGKNLGKSRKGALLRSQDPDRTSYILECPCQTKVWQKSDGKSWITDPEIRIVIRTAKSIIPI